MSHQMPQVKFPYTMAFLSFKYNLTSLNDLFWFSECQSIASKKLFSKHTPEEKITNILGVKNDDSRRYPPSLMDYNIIKKNFSKWIKLNVIVGLSSCLEIYMKTIFTLLLKHNPGLLIGIRDAIKGHRFINLNLIELNEIIYSVVEKMTKGTWQSRASNIAKIFPELKITFSESAISELEFIRKCRNRTGHVFGLDLETYEYSLMPKEVDFIGISLNRLKKIFSVIDNTAQTIDNSIKDNDLLLFELCIFLKSEFESNELSDAYLYPHVQKKIRQRIGQKIGHPILSKEDLIQVLRFYSQNCLVK